MPHPRCNHINRAKNLKNLHHCNRLFGAFAVGFFMLPGFHQEASLMDLLLTV